MAALREPEAGSLLRNETSGSEVLGVAAGMMEEPVPRFRPTNREDEMISQTQIHTIARRMLEQRGSTAIAEAARHAVACESRGEADEAREWRSIEDAMKMMRGPHQS